jgi:hypothetical protein
MENLFIRGNSEVPFVDFNLNGIFLMKGISIAHNPNTIYEPIKQWLTEYKEIAKGNIVLTMRFQYLNTSSLKSIVDIIILINSFANENCSVKFIWEYEEDDEDFYDLGIELEKFSSANVEFVAYKSNE